MGESVTIYVTRNADSYGIRRVQAEVGSNGYAKVPVKGRTYRETLPPATFRMTLEEAIADAERRRARKIASLEKQLAAVRAIDLTKPVAPTPEQTGGE